MVDFHSARSIVLFCLWLSAGVSLLFVLEIMLGDFVRDSLRRLFKQDDAGEGSK